MAAKLSFVLLFLCFSVIALSAGKEYVPLLLIRSSDDALREIGVTGLSKWSSEDFRRYMLKVVNGNEDITKLPLVMIFAEESLSVEDFSWVGAEDFGSYPRLMNESKSPNTIFFPSVHQPLKSLGGLKEAGFKWIKYSSTDISKIASSGKKTSLLTQAAEGAKGVVLYIDLEDADSNEDRPDMLRRHDTLIADVYDMMKTDREVILVYTAGHSSWYEADAKESISNPFDYEDGGREIRSAARRLLADSEQDVANSSDIILTPNKTTGVTGLLYTKSDPILITEENSDGMVLSGFDRSTVTWDDRSNKSRMFINYQAKSLMITIPFTKKNGYWSTPYVDVEFSDNKSSRTSLTPNVHIEAPFGFSYHCSQAVTFKKDATELKFAGFQIQGLMPMPKEDGKIAFGDGYDCVYFFTAPILSGLFVTMLLGFIMIWGLSMIMDIRTMDRFDDPKGKTITIANAE